MDSMLEVGLSIVSTSATAIIGYLVYRLKKHEERKEAEEAERHRQELERARQQKKENEALRASLIALTRDRILQGYRYYRKQGGIGTQDLETMAKLYAAYHDLGGNGTITAVYNKITALQIKGE